MAAVPELPALPDRSMDSIGATLSGAVMEGVRFSDLETFLRRMERLATRKWDWARVWGAASVLLLGAAIGAGFGLFPFLDADPSRLAKIVYFGATGLALVFAVVCLLARLSVIEERGDSVSDLRDDFNKWLATYQSEVARAEPKAPGPTG